jgi:hypothetical protein
MRPEICPGYGVSAGRRDTDCDTQHETNGVFCAPSGLKLTLDEEKKAFILIMEALREQEPKPANFKELGGKQYIAIASGPSASAKAKLVNTPEFKDQRQATVLYVFAL